MDRENPSLPAVSSLDEDKVEATGEMNGDDNLEEDVNGASLDEIIIGPQELVFSNSLIALKVFEKLVLDNVKACRFVNKAWTENATAAVARSSSLNLERIILDSIDKYEADCLAKISSQNPEEENFLAKVEGDNTETEEKEKIPLVCSLSKNLLRNVHLSFEPRNMRWNYKFLKNSPEALVQVFCTFCQTEGDKILKMSLSDYYFKDCVKVIKEILEDFCPHLESFTLRGFGRFLKEEENEDPDQKKNPDDEGEGEKEEIQIENLFPNGLALKFLDVSGIAADSLLIGFINKIILSSPNLVELKVDGVFCPEIPIGPQMKLEKLKNLTISILHRNQADEHYKALVALDVKSFQKTLEGLPNLESLSLISCWCRGSRQNSDEITQKIVPLLRKLKTLTIEGLGMFKLESLKILNKFENLKTLNLAQESFTSIKKYFKFFPEVSKWAMKPHTKVENLNLGRFMKVDVMKSVCAYFPNLKRLEVQFGDYDDAPRGRNTLKTCQLFKVLRQSSLKLTHFKIDTSANFGLANFGSVVHINGSFFKGLKTFEFINGGPHGNNVESMKSEGWKDRLEIQLLPLQHLTSCKLVNFYLEMSDAVKALEFISAKKFAITFPAFEATESDFETAMAEAVEMDHRGETDSEDEDSESSGDDMDDAGSLSSDDFDLAGDIEDFYGGSDFSDDADGIQSEEEDSI